MNYFYIYIFSLLVWTAAGITVPHVNVEVCREFLHERCVEVFGTIDEIRRIAVLYDELNVVIPCAEADGVERDYSAIVASVRHYLYTGDAALVRPFTSDHTFWTQSIQRMVDGKAEEVRETQTEIAAQLTASFQARRAALRRELETERNKAYVHSALESVRLLTDDINLRFDAIRTTVDAMTLNQPDAVPVGGASVREEFAVLVWELAVCNPDRIHIHQAAIRSLWDDLRERGYGDAEIGAMANEFREMMLPPVIGGGVLRKYGKLVSDTSDADRQLQQLQLITDQTL